MKTCVHHRVVIVVSRCVQSRRNFGVRFEEPIPHRWGATWSFATKTERCGDEVEAPKEITGEFTVESVYPGCPHCYRLTLFQCSCGKVACWDGESRRVTCPWCNATHNLTKPVHSLGADNDR